MTKTHSSWTLAVAAAVGICALAGCNQRESSQETAKDVAEERQDANENVAEESREAANTATEGMEDRAEAEYDVAVAQADGQRKIAQEKCETMAGDAQKSCKDQADADYESAKAQAQASLDAAKRSGSAEPAPVLLAMNRPREVWSSSVRFSVGIENTPEQIDRAVTVIANVVNRLRPRTDHAVSGSARESVRTHGG